MDPGSIVANGSLLLAVPIALLAGFVSFASPCVLPLVPGYLGYISGFASGGRGLGGDDRGAATRGTGAVAVSGPLGADPEVARTVLARYAVGAVELVPV